MWPYGDSQERQNATHFNEALIHRLSFTFHNSISRDLLALVFPGGSKACLLKAERMRASVYNSDGAAAQREASSELQNTAAASPVWGQPQPPALELKATPFSHPESN